MRHKTIIGLMMALALIAAACSSEESGGDTVTVGDTGSTDSVPHDDDDEHDEEDAGDSGSDGVGCPDELFTGEIVSPADGDNVAVSLTGDDIVLAQAVVRSADVAYTIYLADYDLGDQEVGFDTVQADPGQVVVTVIAEAADGLEVGETHEVIFNPIIDAGGGASATYEEPTYTIRMIDITDDQICFEADFSDLGGSSLRGTISADIVT